MRRLLRSLILVLGAVCGVASLALAQSGLGSITGTIVDETGASLSGATVRVVEASTGAARSSVSNDAGLFTVPAVPSGTYTITITRQDFKTKQLANIALSSLQQLSLGLITLEVSVGPTDIIEVSASRPQLDLDSGVRFEAIQASQVRDMPLQGRNWSSLLKVIPGATPTNNEAINGREYSASGYGDFRINGKNPQQTQVNLDGGSLVDHGSDAKTTVAPSLESIDEVSVLTNNFQAEYGNRGGTVINIVTKSGTNQFRGALFDYLRNEALNANSWANNFRGDPKPVYRYNYFGGNLGGPIKRNRLFFFYNYENFKQDTPGATVLGRVPTELERQGDFSQTFNPDGTRPIIYFPGTQFTGTPVPIPNNIIPSSMINPLGQALLNLYPLPNYTGDRTNNYVFNYQVSQPRYSHTVKVDWEASERTHLYARFTGDDGTLVDRNVSNTTGLLLAGLVKRPRPDRALAVNATHTFSPTFVMNSLFGWSYDFVEWLPNDPDGLSKSALGLSGLPTVFPVTDDIIPAVNIGVYGEWAFNRMPAYAKANEWQAATTFTWARGSHIIKFGAQTILNYKDEIDNSVNKGSYDFRPNTANRSSFDSGYGPANALLGGVTTFTQIEQVNRKNSIYQDIHAFVQDTWKPARGLTLDYGLRFYHMPTEHNRNSDDTLDAVFLPSRWDAAKAPRLYVPDPKNPTRIIDPAFPDQPLPTNLTNVLRYTMVPGSGDPMNGVVQLGKNGISGSGIRDPRTLLFAPRGGFAWTPFDSQRTVVRGGFGWAYNRNNIADTINRFENGLGRVANLAQTSLDTMAAPTTAQPILVRSVGARDESNNRVPTVYDYSVSVQHQLFATLVVDVAYIGNQQRNQPVSFNINAIAPGTAFRSEFIDPSNAGYNFAGPISASNPGPALPGSNTVDPLVMRPYRGFNTLMMNTNAANVSYNALQVNVSKRVHQGFALDVSYTLGRTKGQIENLGLFNGDWQAYTGYKINTDRLHVLNVNYIYDTPKVATRVPFLDNPIGRAVFDDWKLAHLLTIFSGQDYSPIFTIQQANTTSNVDLGRVLLGTPDLTPRLGVSGNPNDASGDLAHQFDPAALSVPAIFPGADGTGPRNFITGPWGFANDVSLIKQFPLRGGPQRIEIRANFYNIFNNVRRTALNNNANTLAYSGINNNITFKANGRTFADGFTVFNTPEQLLARSQANGVTDPLLLYNQYRAGVGHVDLTNVQAPRIIEIGFALRF